MFNSFSNIIIAVALVFALIGQNFAYASMACDMSEEKMNSSLNHQEMNHQEMGQGGMAHSALDHSAMGHASNDPAATDSTHTEARTMVHSDLMMKGDCCDVECSCPASACSSLSFLSLQMPMFNTPSSQFKIIEVVGSHANFYLSSLNRPPILPLA